MDNLIIVSDWERVQPDDFYLSKDWEKSEDKERIDEAKKLQKEGHLYVAYVVDAKNYAIYWQMDADQVFINEDGDIILNCESGVIGNDHKHRAEYPL